MGAVYLLVGGVALIAVVTVVLFGEETTGRRLEAINRVWPDFGAP